MRRRRTCRDNICMQRIGVDEVCAALAEAGSETLLKKLLDGVA